VRQDPASAPAFANATAQAKSAEHEKLKRELAELERNLRKREHDMTVRERELAEQRRVLADQFRLLKTNTQGQGPAPAAWPPADANASATARTSAAHGPQPMHARAFAPYATKRRFSLWRRVKNSLLGTPERVLEDSL
jgi:hypothetical protein